MGLCQLVEMNVFCLCTWLRIRQASAPLTSEHVLQGFLSTGLLYLEPVLCATYRRGSCNECSFPLAQLPQIQSSFPHFNCAFKDCFQNQRKRGENPPDGISDWKRCLVENILKQVNFYQGLKMHFSVPLFLFQFSAAILISCLFPRSWLRGLPDLLWNSISTLQIV